MSSNSTTSLPGRLLRMTLQIYRNQNSTAEDREKFAREYLAKAAALHAKNGIEMYQQVTTRQSSSSHVESSLLQQLFRSTPRSTIAQPSKI